MTLIANAALLPSVQAAQHNSVTRRFPRTQQWRINRKEIARAISVGRACDDVIERKPTLFRLRRPPPSHNREKQAPGNTKVTVPLMSNAGKKVLHGRHPITFRQKRFWMDEVQLDGLQYDQEEHPGPD